MIEVKCYNNVTEDLFLHEIEPKREPALLKNVDVGSCVEKWNLKYLMENVGQTEVKIHVTTSPAMDFINKNFLYCSLPFDELLKRIAREEQTEFFINEKELYYLRSLGDNPRKDVADIRNQFPLLAADLKIPNFFKKENFFSSVFRIASPGLQLWTHYDIMDNILIQVQGRKRVILFSPKDVNHLYLVGDKSSVLDIDNPDEEKYPNFKKATRYECWMNPGDILFIPALWFHNVISVTTGIAVNVFWYHLDPNNYDKKDIYGNKDFPTAMQAMQFVNKAVKCLEPLPEDYKEFYLRRCISHLEKQILKR